jgi:hypothetical protein
LRPTAAGTDPVGVYYFPDIIALHEVNNYSIIVAVDKTTNDYADPVEVA